MPSTGAAKAAQNNRRNKIRDARIAVAKAMRRIAAHEASLQDHAPLLAETVAVSTAGGAASCSQTANGVVVARLVPAPSGVSLDAGGASSSDAAPAPANESQLLESSRTEPHNQTSSAHVSSGPTQC